MEAVVFCGVQASGKSSYYAAHFADTHVRINRDMLRTEHRELALLHACLAVRQPFVIDNTNPSRGRRERYIQLARASGFKVVGYFFDVTPDEALARNARRERQVPEVAIRGTATKLQRPTVTEGYDQLFRVTADGAREEVRDA